HALQGLPPAVARLVAAPGRANRLLHVRTVPGREATACPWSGWADPDVVAAFARRGIVLPWRHQVEAAEAAHQGEHVTIATGTASGKSLAYLLPALSAVVEGSRTPSGRDATVLYLAPTKSL